MMSTIKVNGLLQRQISFQREAFNTDSRTVELSVSSETAVKRWFGNEILDHAATSVRLGRLKRGGPVLVDHHGDQVGVVDDVTLDTGKRRLNARLRFGSGQRATEILQDIQDGIRQNVSIGYQVHKLMLEATDEGGETYRAVDWEPYEISIVSIPADISVGVGRSKEHAHEIIVERGNSMPEVIETPDTQAQDKPVPVTVDRARIENEVRTLEMKRIRDLEALGDRFSQYDGRELSRQMIRDGRSVEDFRNAILEKLPKLDVAGSGGMPASALGLSATDQRNYSLLRAINASMTGDWSKAGLERECSVAVADKLGREARGFYVPYDALSKRVMTTGAASGGKIVPTDYMPDEFIDRLRVETIIAGLGARYLTGLTGNADIPGLSTGATFYWLAEDANVTDSDIGLRNVTMTPKTVAGSVAMSRRLLLQSSPSIESLIQDDLLKGMALAIDNAAINGTGAANQPTGLMVQAGILTQAVVTAGAPTLSEMRKFKTAMKKANSYIGNPTFLTTPDVAGYLEDTPIDTGSGRFLLENDKCVGIPLKDTNLMPANKILLGNFADVLIGMWGTLDLVTDTSTKAASGGIVLRIFQDADIAIRRTQSFVKSA